jgi:hypothetical protein
MRKSLLSTIVLIALILAAVPRAQAQAPAAGFRWLVGYKYIDIDYDFTHDTHPDDSFLPGAGVHGSAGKTHLNGLHFAAIGVRYQASFSDSFSYNLDAGGLVGGDRDRHKNANDMRPDENAAFVYSDTKFGFFAATGLSYHIERFYVGAEAQLSGVYIESGWDRFDHDQKQDSKIQLLPSCGPKIGYQINDNWSIESTVQFGRATTFGVQVIWKF